MPRKPDKRTWVKEWSRPRGMPPGDPIYRMQTKLREEGYRTKMWFNPKINRWELYRSRRKK